MPGPAPNGAVVMAKFVRSGSDYEPRGGALEAGVGSTSITLDTVGAEEYVPIEWSSSIGSLFLNDCDDDCDFQQGSATFQDAGHIGSAGTDRISWGRWEGSYSYREDDDPVGTTDIMHSIFSQDISTAAQIGAQSGAATFLYSGGPGPTDELGQAGSINATNTRIDVDFTSQQMTAYDLEVSTPGRTWDARLDGSAVDFADIFSTDDAITLIGTCNGTGCAQPGVADDARGVDTLSFVGQGVNRAMSGFDLRDGNDQTGVQGVMALDRQ